MESLPDDEASRSEEAYVASVVGDCPAFGPDARQAMFFEQMDQWRKEHKDWKGARIIPMNGFRASAVDLGWLKDKAVKIVREKFDECGPYGLAHLVCLILQRCVQRLKAEMVGYDADRNTIEVCFQTKDDEGYYEYRLAVPLPWQEDGDRDGGAGAEGA